MASLVSSFQVFLKKENLDDNYWNYRPIIPKLQLPRILWTLA